MALEIIKPLGDESALAGEISSSRGQQDILPNRIKRYETAKLRADLNIQYLRSPDNFLIDEERDLRKRLESCSNWFVFRDYYTLGEIKLVRASFCMKHLMCPLCAIRRAAKSLSAYLERFEVIRSENPRLVPYLLTLTVSNGEDLNERFNHLVDSWKVYQNRRRQYFKNGRGFNELCKAEGAVFTYEFTKSSEGWHPHLHAIVMIDPSDPIDFDFNAPGYKKSNSKLSQEWLSITGDSSIVDCRPINMKDPVKSFCEVFKYALKFSDLTPEDNYHAHTVLKGKRLQGSFGLFWGVKVPTKLTDEFLPDELPYIELFYRYTKSGYTIKSSFVHDGGVIEPQKTKDGCSLDSKTEQAFEKLNHYRRTSWWLAEKYADT